MNFTIRKGEAKDAEEALMLIRELAVYEKAENEVEVNLKQFIEDGFGENAIYDMLVAEKNNQLIGLALYYEKYSTWKGRCLYLEDLIVTEKERGIGAGKALFNAVIKEAQKRQSGRMEWQVLNWNTPSINFYKSYDAQLDEGWINCKFTREALQKQLNESI